jgi:tetratricopeptide (TPR) repeat protein
VDPKPRWQALQARLTAARASMAAGDRERALQEIDAALEIDPEFLAARSLRDRLASGDLILTAWPPNARSIAGPETSATPVAPSTSSPPSAPSAMAADAEPDRPLPHSPVSTGGYARFEERAKRRRVERQLRAARAAIEGRGLREAAAALDEVIELDPHVPELAALTDAFDDLRRSKAARTRRGPWFAAAAAFAVTVLGASWIEDQGALWSRPITVLTALVQPAAPAPLVTAAVGDRRPEPPGAPGSATGGMPAGDLVAAPRQPVPSATPASLRSATPLAEPAVLSGASASAEAVAAPPLSAVFAPVPPLSLPAPGNATAPARPPNAPVPSSSETPATVAKPSADDELMVKQALQRYRIAYDGLDAQSAQAVWPAVNQAALARAFDGLASQSLTFDRCDVQLHTDTATATCHGNARYVPKIGSREARTEPRVWNFTLRKGSADWKIDNARVGR